MNNSLPRNFTKEEVETTSKQMVPLKSSGLDGFGVVFYQKHWKTVGNDVCEAVLSIFHGESMNSSFNSNFNALIPKKPNLDVISNFQPISLCNVLYKLVSKIITNRLKSIMHSIIFSNQSAFIVDRLITDNIIVAHELLHSMR